jgi:hypothetical protein
MLKFPERSSCLTQGTPQAGTPLVITLESGERISTRLERNFSQPEFKMPSPNAQFIDLPNMPRSVATRVHR